MNEYRSSVVFATPDLPLREDVRRLGTMVGELISEQVAPAFLDEVEEVRTAAIARRESQGPLATLSAQLAGRTPRQAEALVRAFSTYFQVVNIAERVHRIRRRRHYQRAGTKPCITLSPRPNGAISNCSIVWPSGWYRIWTSVLAAGGSSTTRAFPRRACTR